MNNEQINNYLDGKYLFYIENDILQIVKPKFIKIKLPKNRDLVTIDWIESKIDTENTFVNLSKILRNMKLKGVNIYSASYGIGVFAYFNFDFKQDLDKIRNLLNTNNIEYIEEYSDREYVYRFKISKNKYNLDKLNNITLN